MFFSLDPRKEREKKAHVVVLEVRAQYSAAKFTDVRHDKATPQEPQQSPWDNLGKIVYLVPSSVQLMN